MIDRKGMTWLAMGCLLLLAVIAALPVVIDAAWLASFSYGTSRPETFILYGAARWADGEPLYPPIGDEPYIINVYNPLTYAPMALGRALFSLDLVQTLWLGRATSIAALLALLLLMGRWLWQYTGQWMLGLILVLALLAWDSVALPDFFRARPELPALLLTWAGLLCLARENGTRPTVASVFFAAAFFVKQPFIIAVVAACLWMAWERRWRDLIRFSATYGICLLAGFFFAYGFTGRHFFMHTLGAMASNEVTLFGADHQRLWRDFLALFWAPLLALPFALWCLRRELVSRRGLRLLLCYGAVLLPWVFYSSAKYGAYLNYFMELSVLILLLLTLGVGVALNDREPGVASYAVVLLLLIGLVHGASSALFGHGHRERFLPVNVVDLAPQLRALASEPGPKLITHESLAVHSGEVVGLDWFLLADLNKKGRLNLQPLYLDIEAGRFAHVILDRRKWTGPHEAWLRALDAGPYRQVGEDEIAVYFERTESE